MSLVSKPIQAWTLSLCICLSFLAVPAASDGQETITSTPPAPRLFRPGNRLRSLSSRYVPDHTRTVSSGREIIIQEGDAPPTISEELPTVPHDVRVQAPMDVPMDEVYTEYPGDDCCGDCGDCGGGCGIGGCGCGDCWGGIPEDPRDCGDCGCWMDGLGSNAEYFFGVHGFKGPGSFENVLIPGVNAIGSAGSFGFHGGINVGLPLYRLTCGKVSGQIGFNYVTSNYVGSPFATDDRSQLFFTGGLFRRVDYGLQFGVVVDVLREEWFDQLDLVQLRGELSWVKPEGHMFGFRFAIGVQDDVNDRFFGQNPNEIGEVLLNGIVTDTYRFFCRKVCGGGGYSEFFAGWSGVSHGLVGVDYELPINDKFALQSGFTYLIPRDTSEDLLGNNEEVWNVTVGVTFRPRGRCWYKWYHRPLLPVADNGSMIIGRRALIVFP